MPTLRMRFWVETLLGAVGTVLGLLTLWVPDWLERIGGDQADAGSGATEWTIAVSFIAFAVVAGAFARAEYARSRRVVSR